MEGTKPSRLLVFFVKTLTLFLIGTGIAYSIWLKFTMPAYLSFRFSIELEYGIIFFVIPISLLLESISIVIYGIFKTKLKPWEIFLSSFYATAFVSLSVLILMQRAPASPYSSAASAIGAFLWSLLLSLFIAGVTAGVLTVIYTIIKKPGRIFSMTS